MFNNEFDDILNKPIKKKYNKINIIILFSFFINICILLFCTVLISNYNDIVNIKAYINKYIKLIDYVKDNTILNNETKTAFYINKIVLLVDKACDLISCD